MATPASFWLALLVLVFGAVWIQFLPESVVKFLNSEIGPFEQASVAFLAAAALLAFACWLRYQATPWLASGIVFVYAVLRELDFQKIFTYRSVMSLGYFTRPIAPLPEKLLVLLLMLPCLAAIVFLVRKLLPRVVNRRFLATNTSSVAAAIWVAVLFVMSHLGDRTLWFRLPNHIEAWVECIFALAALLLVVELKPTLLKD
jgi:hypothetical protein